MLQIKLYHILINNNQLKQNFFFNILNLLKATFITTLKSFS